MKKTQKNSILAKFADKQIPAQQLNKIKGGAMMTYCQANPEAACCKQYTMGGNAC